MTATITPEALNEMWQQDKHQIAWLLHDLTPEQRDELAVAYHHWLNRGDIRLAHVQSSFEATLWLTEPHNPEYKPRPNVVTPDAALPIFRPSRHELDAAYTQASAHDMPQAWRKALDAAYCWLLELDGCAVEYADESIAVAHIPSATEPGVTYRVNGECQCKAHEHNRPCWHRAARRLLAICCEGMENPK
jgi:hypothetical protein